MKVILPGRGGTLVIPDELVEKMPNHQSLLDEWTAAGAILLPDGGEFIPMPPDERTIYRRLADVKRECPAIPKADRNTEQNFDFRGIERIMASVSPLFAKHGVLVMPRVQSIRRWITERGRDHKPWEHYRIEVVYRFYGELGDHVDARVYGEGLDNADKGISKAMTMAEKVAMLQVLSICDPADDDPDARGPVEELSPRRNRARGRNEPPPPDDQGPPPDPAPKPPTLDEQIAASAEKYGDDHAEAVRALVGRLNAVEDDDARKSLKRAFAGEFGPLAEIEPDAMARASGWADTVLAAPDATPAPESQPASTTAPVADDQPPTPGTCRVCGAPASDSTGLYCGDHEPF